MNTQTTYLLILLFLVHLANGDESINALVMTNPASAIAYGGTSHVFTCTLSESTIGSDYHEIKWLYKGPNDSTSAQMVGNGDVFNDQNERIIDGTIANTADSGAKTITSTLTINDITSDAEGEYNCAIKWGKVFIDATPVSLKVREISIPPQTTNVAKGGEAKFTCKSSGDSKSTITFHKTSNDDAVDSVVETEETSGDHVITTGVLTISAAAAANSMEYYCKATWSGNEVKSANVYLSVLDMVSSTETVWGILDNTAIFDCQYNTLLKANAGGDSYLVDSEKVYATTQITWELYDSSDSSWKSTSSNARLAVKPTTTNNAGVRVSQLSLRDLLADDTGFKVRCTIVYQSDTNSNFYGATIISPDLTLTIGSITTFTPTKSDPIVGETITLTCIATGETAPTFSFTTGGTGTFDTTYLQVIENPDTESDGTTHTKKYVVKAVKPNVKRSGQLVGCTADYGQAQKDDKEMTITTYFDCNTVTVKTHNPSDVSATITATDLGGGSLKQTIACPADTSSARYALKTDSGEMGSAAEITCTRETGKYDPPYLARCAVTTPFTSGTGSQKITIGAGVSGAPCSDDAAGEWSIASMKLKLNSQTDTTCGFKHKVACLVAGTCTLDTAKTECSYDSVAGKIIIQYFVNFNTPLWTATEKDAGLVLSGNGRVQFWSCSGTYNKR